MIPSYASNASLYPVEDFNPSPALFTWLSRVYLPISVLIFPLGFYCVWLKSSIGMTLTYKIFYSIMIFYSFCMHMMIWISIPVFIFPYHIAIMMTGIAPSFGISSNLLFSLLFTLGCAILSTNLSLFYYRTEAILPPSHFHYKTIIRKAFYSIIYTHYLPIFFIIYFEANTSQKEVKRLVFEEVGFVTEYLWDERTVVYHVLFLNRFVLLLIGYTVIFAGIPLAMTGLLTVHVIILLFNLYKTASKRLLHLQMILIETLFAQIAVYAILFAAPLIFIFLFSFYFDYRNNAVIMAASCVLGSSPAGGVLTMVLVNKDYREYLIPWLKKYAPSREKRMSIYTGVVSTIVSTEYITFLRRSRTEEPLLPSFPNILAENSIERTST